MAMYGTVEAALAASTMLVAAHGIIDGKQVTHDNAIFTA